MFAVGCAVMTTAPLEVRLFTSEPLVCLDGDVVTFRLSGNKLVQLVNGEVEIEKVAIRMID